MAQTVQARSASFFLVYLRGIISMTDGFICVPFKESDNIIKVSARKDGSVRIS